MHFRQLILLTLERNKYRISKQKRVVNGDSAIAESTFRRWFARFTNGHLDLENRDWLKYSKLHNTGHCTYACCKVFESTWIRETYEVWMSCYLTKKKMNWWYSLLRHPVNSKLAILEKHYSGWEISGSQQCSMQLVSLGLLCLASHFCKIRCWIRANNVPCRTYDENHPEFRNLKRIFYQDNPRHITLKEPIEILLG